MSKDNSDYTNPRLEIIESVNTVSLPSSVTCTKINHAANVMPYSELTAQRDLTNNTSSSEENTMLTDNLSLRDENLLSENQLKMIAYCMRSGAIRGNTLLRITTFPDNCDLLYVAESCESLKFEPPVLEKSLSSNSIMNNNKIGYQDQKGVIITNDSFNINEEAIEGDRYKQEMLTNVGIRNRIFEPVVYKEYLIAYLENTADEAINQLHQRKVGAYEKCVQLLTEMIIIKKKINVLQNKKQKAKNENRYK